MEGYDLKSNIEEKWTYRELLEMIYVEDLKAIREHKAIAKYQEEEELKTALENGR
jgi:hypothetical protein